MLAFNVSHIIIYLLVSYRGKSRIWILKGGGGFNFVADSKRPVHIAREGGSYLVVVR